MPLPESPQRKPSHQSDDLHRDERQHRRVLVRGDHVLREFPLGLQDEFRRVAAQIRRDRHESDAEEHHIAGSLEVVTVSDERGRQQPDAETEADGRNVVQQQMQMRQVHEMNSLT